MRARKNKKQQQAGEQASRRAVAKIALQAEIAEKRIELIELKQETENKEQEQQEALDIANVEVERLQAAKEKLERQELDIQLKEKNALHG